MMRRLSILLAILLVSTFSFTACNKKDAKKDADTKKEVKKDAKKDTKKVAKKEVKKTAKTADKLDLSYFPETAVLVGSFDTQKFMGIKEIKPLLKAQLEQVKAMGIDLEKAGFVSYYLDIQNMKKAEDVAVLVKGLAVSEKTLEALNIKYKKEKHGDVELLVSPREDGALAMVGKDLIAGSVKSVKAMLDVKAGKVKSLAKTDLAKEFNKMMKHDAVFQAVVVPNKLIKEEIKKLTEKEAAMAAEFLNNMTAASLSISLDKANFVFAIHVQSSKAGADSIMAMATPILAQLKQENSPMLANVKPMLGEEGTKILAEVIKTLKVENKEGLLSVMIATKLEYWLKAPKILGGAMMGGMAPTPGVKATPKAEPKKEMKK